VSSVRIVGSRSWPLSLALRVVALGIAVPLVLLGAEIVGSTRGFQGERAFVGVVDENSSL
jgi:hypothetical protein